MASGEISVPFYVSRKALAAGFPQPNVALRYRRLTPETLSSVPVKITLPLGGSDAVAAGEGSRPTRDLS